MLPDSDKNASGKTGAIHNLGVAYQYGRGTDPDIESAFKWYEKSSNTATAKGQLALGSLYFEGNGVEKNIQKAIDLFEKASQGGVGDASTKLGLLYEEGIHIAQDHAKAREYYEKGGNQGDPWGFHNLGYKYHAGIGVEQNISRAIALYEKSAILGLTRSMRALAMIYQQDEYQKDIGKGLEWLYKANNLGDLDATVALGQMHMLGQFLEKDRKKAFEYFRMAADKKHVNGLFFVGYMYESSADTRGDLRAAVKWYELASARGHQQAKVRLVNIQNYLNGNQ